LSRAGVPCALPHPATHPHLTRTTPRPAPAATTTITHRSHNARQCLLTRGLLPMLATPQPHGDAVLGEAIAMASRLGIVKPNAHVVAVQRIHEGE
jgi:hypothetical protein